MKEMRICITYRPAAHPKCDLSDVSFPSILVTVPPIKARPVLHFAACFSVRLNQPGSKRRGRIPEAFFFITAVFASMPHLLLRCFASIFYREKGPAVPSVVDNEVELCQLAKLFSFLPLSIASYESEVNPLSLRFEPVK